MIDELEVGVYNHVLNYLLAFRAVVNNESPPKTKSNSTPIFRTFADLHNSFSLSIIIALSR